MKNREDKHELVLGLKELASRGMTEEVVEEINEMDSNFFVQNPSLLFQLKQVWKLKLLLGTKISRSMFISLRHLKIILWAG